MRHLPEDSKWEIIIEIQVFQFALFHGLLMLLVLVFIMSARIGRGS